MKNRFSFFLWSSLVIVCAACTGQESADPLFELLPPEQTGVHFVNELIEDDSLNVLAFDYMYNGGGVATGDFNNDGLMDLFFTGNNVSSRLYLNKGGMQFEDVTGIAGVATDQWAEGVTLVDLNNDGWLDIYISTSSGYRKQLNSNLLFINNGLTGDSIPSFTERAAEYGIAATGFNTQAAFFDYDLDGHLDLYVLSNAIEDYNRNKPRPRKLKGEGKSTDRLYRNNGNGTFSDVSKEAGILVEGYGLGLAISDINKDGWPDIYVANDFITNDILYLNNGDGTFTNRVKELMKHQSMYGMGTDVADYNNDGLVDIVVMDMMPDHNLRQKTMFPNTNYDRYMLDLRMGYQPQFIRNTLQLNNGNGPTGQPSFSEIGQMAGVYKTDWSWAPLLADFDNDGLRDLFISNGYGKDVTDMDFVVYSTSLQQFGTPETKQKQAMEEMKKLIDVKIPNYMFRNNGDLTFSDQSANWGFEQPSLSNGAAYADLDNDGDLDLVLNNVNEVAFIYENKSEKLSKKTGREAHFLKLDLKGDSLNLQGLGTKITLSYKKGDQWEKQYYEHYLTRGYKSTVSNQVHFGLGAVGEIDSLEVRWPDGRVERLAHVQANQLLVLEYSHAQPARQVGSAVPSRLFTEVSGPKKIRHKDQKTAFVDFKMQPLLPHKHSENGPGLAVGDVNGNGLEDFYVGGSSMQPGSLFMQEADGTFVRKSLTDTSEYDDMGALFFDADNDGDLDLYVVSGGSRFKEGAPQYQDRLYMNDGKGDFTLQADALPEMMSSGSVITAADYDGDGDLDLFIGGRIVPQNYPLPSRSYILRNDGGRFADVTKEICPELEQIGLVTAAIWSDFNQDRKVDLILTGEWMPVTVLEQVKTPAGKISFENATASAGLAKTNGWWNSIVGGDFDGDGNVDYVVGNLGLNSRYKASASEPVSVYAKDFDQSGTIDPIMFNYIMGENYPAHPRDALISQITYMRGRFPRYADYGNTTLDSFFADGELDDAYVLKSYEFRSSYIRNNGDGTFSVEPLPLEVQVSPVNGVLCRDFNQDGHLDLLMIGNSYATETQVGRYDASIGSYLEGDGKGNFNPVAFNKSGFYVDGDAKAMVELSGRDDELLILVSQHADSLKVFSTAYKGKSIAFKPEPTDQRAEIFLPNGKKIIHEFYHGSSYLSQSSRRLAIQEQVDSVEVFDYTGKSRKYRFSKKMVLQ